MTKRIETHRQETSGNMESGSRRGSNQEGDVTIAVSDEPKNGDLNPLCSTTGFVN